MYYKNFFFILSQSVKRSGWCFKIERISLINDEMLCDKFGLELFGILKQKSKAEQTQDRTRVELVLFRTLFPTHSILCRNNWILVGPPMDDNGST